MLRFPGVVALAIAVAGCSDTFTAAVDLSTAYEPPAYEQPYLGFSSGMPGPGAQVAVLLLDARVYTKGPIIVDLESTQDSESPPSSSQEEPGGDLAKQPLEDPTPASPDHVLTIPRGEDHAHYLLEADGEGHLEAVFRAEHGLLVTFTVVGGDAGPFGECDRMYMRGENPVWIELPGNRRADVPFSISCEGD